MITCQQRMVYTELMVNGDWYLFDVHGRMVTGFSTSDFDIRGWKTIITMMAISTMEQTEEDATMLDGR